MTAMANNDKSSKDESNRDKALRGEVVLVTDERLSDMQSQAIALEGVDCDSYHWHWAAVLNELIARRADTLPAVETTPVITPIESLLVEWWGGDMDNAELFNRAVRLSPALAEAMNSLPEKSQ
jgi:hypothetical protein